MMATKKVITESSQGIGHFKSFYSGWIFFCLLGMIIVKGQGYQNLEKLIEKSENVTNPKISDNGKWAAWYSSRDDLKHSEVIIGSTEDPNRQYIRKSVSQWTFGNSCIALLNEGILEVLQFGDGSSIHFQNVRSTEYLKDQDLLIVHYNDKGNKRIEAYDSKMTKKLQLENVRFFLRKDRDFFIVTKNDDLSEVYQLSSKKLRKIRSTPNDITDVWSVGILAGGFIIGEKKIDGVAVVYVSQNLGITELDDLNTSGFEKVRLETSMDKNNVFLSFSNVVSPKKEDVQIWYGNEAYLAKYISGYVEYYKMIWNPVTDIKKMVSLQDFEKETSIGTHGLILKLLKDKQQVENRDLRSGRGYDKLFIWHPLTGQDSFLADAYGKVVIHPNGKYATIMDRKGWVLHSIPKGESSDLGMSLNAVPFFSYEHQILWISEGKLIIQDIRNLKKKILADFGKVGLELINAEIQQTSLGYGRNFGFADHHKALLLKVSESEGQVSYIMWKNGKIQSVVEKTSDYVSEFQKAKDCDSFVWLTENYNKAPTVMVKVKSSSEIPIYQSNKELVNSSSLKRIVVHYKGSDGKDLSGALYLPINYNASHKYPIVTHIYESQRHLTNRFFKATFFNTVGINESLLLESGFGVFLPDLSYSDKGPAVSALESINNALEELIKIQQVDPSRIGLIGQSFGGYETSFIAANSDRFAAYIAGASVTDIIRFSYGFNKGFSAPDYWRVEGRQYEFKSSLAANREKYFSNNPILYAQNINKPILLWTGTGDTNVDFEHTRSMFLALRKFRKPVIGLFYKDEQHSFLQQKNQKDLSLKMIDWWNYFLKDQQGIPWIDQQMKGAD